MRVLLIQPDVPASAVGFSSLVLPEPLPLELVAASVIPEHEVKLLDLRIEPSSLEPTLTSFSPDIVGITGFTIHVPRMLQICSQVKEHNPKVVTVVGGYHATLCPEDFDFPYVDVIALGEGEVTFKHLVRALEKKEDLAEVKGIIYRRAGGQVKTSPRKPVRNLDRLPLPVRHLSDQYRSHYYFHFWENPYLVETARGCPYRCIFCAVWMFHQKLCRFRSPQKVVEDLKGIPSRIVCFVDDNFFQNIRRAEELAGLLEAEGLHFQSWCQARADTIVRYPEVIARWAKLGLDSILIGFEKISDADLAAVNKRSSVKINEKAAEILGELGVDIWGTFIIDPSWTERDFDALIDYIRRVKIAFPAFLILTPIPGTIFYQEKKRELRLRNYELFDFFHSVLPTRLPLEEFYQHVARLYSATGMGWLELKRRIKAGRIPASALPRVRDLLRDVTNPRAYLRGLEPTQS